jgi:hypothetical protein
MMTDKYLREIVLEELDFEPSVDASQTGVAVDNGPGPPPGFPLERPAQPQEIEP